MWTVGVYYPTTKHLNLVTDYLIAKDLVDNKVATDSEVEVKTISLGAILFF